MKKPNPQHQVTRAVGNATLAYKYLLGFFALTVIIGAATGDLPAFAGEAGGDFSEFSAFVCQLRDIIGKMIGALAVVMIIIAGIMYASSGISDKGAATISSSKAMITSAITGVVFYMLTNVLLGQCQSTVPGGLFGGIFRDSATMDGGANFGGGESTDGGDGDTGGGGGSSGF